MRRDRGLRGGRDSPRPWRRGSSGEGQQRERDGRQRRVLILRGAVNSASRLRFLALGPVCTSGMADVVFVLLTVAVFAVLALVVRGVERL